MMRARTRPNLWVSPLLLTPNMTSQCTATSTSSPIRRRSREGKEIQWRSRTTQIRITSIPQESNREEIIPVEALPIATRSLPREVSCKNLSRVRVHGKSLARKFHSAWVMKATTKSTTSIWALDLIRTSSPIRGKSSMRMEPQRRPYPRNRLKGETRMRWTTE